MDQESQMIAPLPASQPSENKPSSTAPEDRLATDKKTSASVSASSLLWELMSSLASHALDSG